MKACTTLPLLCSLLHHYPTAKTKFAALKELDKQGHGGCCGRILLVL
jgi:hypothetical protein